MSLAPFFRAPRHLWNRALRTSNYGSMLALTMGSNLLTAVLGVVTGAIAARLLGPTGRGEMVAIQGWPTILSFVSALGLQNGLMYYAAREPALAGRRLTSAVITAIFACIPFAFVGYMIMPWLLSAQGAEIVHAARIYLWFLLVSVLMSVPLFPLRGINDLVSWNFLKLLPNVTWLVILIISWSAGFTDPTMISFYFLVGQALLAIPIWWVIFYRIPGPFQPSAALVPPMLKFGFPSFLSTLPSTLNLRLDQMVMAALIGPHLLGLYVVAVAWSSAATPILSALSITILPRVAGSDSEDVQKERFAQSCRIGVLLALILSTGVVLTTPIAIPVIFGTEFVAAIPIAMLLAIGAGVTAYNQLLTVGSMGLGYPRFALYAEAGGLFMTMSLLWVLLPPFKLFGAAVTSLASYLTVSGIFLFVITRRTGLKPYQLLLPRRNDISLVINKLRILIQPSRTSTRQATDER